MQGVNTIYLGSYSSGARLILAILIALVAKLDVIALSTKNNCDSEVCKVQSSESACKLTNLLTSNARKTSMLPLEYVMGWL